MFAELLRILKPFWPLALVSTLMGTASGFATTALLATINDALHTQGGATTALLLLFAGLAVLTLVGETVSDIGNSLVGQRVVARLRHDLCARILTAPVAELERYRLHRLTAVLNQDVDTITQFTFNFSGFAISIAIALGCFAYLAVLSPMMFLIALVAIILGTAGHTYARRNGFLGFAAAREAEDELQKQYRAITEGAKELRINRRRRAEMYNVQLDRTISLIRDLRMRAVRIFCTANAFGSALFFVVIGLMLAIQSMSPSADQKVISGFVLVLLYVKGPIEGIVAMLPLLGRAQVSLRRIADLRARFSEAEPHLPLTDRASGLEPLERLDLAGARFAFPAPEGGAAFELGPIDLTIRRGEIVFITGENGGGKTTLIKLLLGLYEPVAGEVRYNGRPLTPELRDDYRQMFSTIFTDYYLFDDLNLPDGVLPDEARRYLEELEIAHKVSVKDGRFTTTDLSTGQRKRLALVHAWLEGRPVLVFDEWAADQDPEFRRIFYTELLPALKAQGRTIIAISHDDRYFHIADRHIRMQAGRVIAADGPDQDAPAQAEPRPARVG
ncbi:cyclic peptide export ABC transporter [Tistrella mobilis]